ncbi:MAG TPA: LytTR family DNA-binding domain-containing protein [Ohtaekwangia sp.]|nr:LytTR family DNA-binding domain-containing protein [Ohtaekwangia sp.]
MLKAVIVDDEKDSREILAGYLTRYCPDVTVCGFGESVSTGLAAIREHNPDVVFLDIEMPYGNGFDLLQKADPVTFETVFVTAFDSYGIQALNQSAAYYLLKPIDIDELVKAVERIRQERQREDYLRHASVLLENMKSNGATGNQKIMLPTMEGFEVVPVSTIMYCEAVDNFTRFHFDDRRELLICRTLKFVEDVLKAHSFFRIHRSWLINPEFVIRYSKGKGGTVTMKNNRELDVAPNRKAEFLDFFGRM